MLSKVSRDENIGDSNVSNDNLGVKVLIKELNSIREFKLRLNLSLITWKRLSLLARVKIVLKMLMTIWTS